MILDALIAPRALERRFVPLDKQSLTWDDLVELELGDGGKVTKAGVRIDPGRAERLSTVFSCVRVIAETIATLPVKTFRRLDGGGREEAREHPLHRVLSMRPNPHMTAVTFWETWITHLALRGNAFAEIEWAGNGYPRALWPIPPNRVSPRRPDTGERFAGQKVLDVELPNGSQVTLRPGQYLHVPLFSFDGVSGRSPISVAREAIGLAVAAEEFGSRFFGQGAHPGFVVTHPNSFKTDEGRGRVLNMLRKMMSGLEESHRVGLLEEGMQIERVGLSQRDSQFLETRKFQKREIAALFRVPAHKVGDLEDAHHTNIEQQNLEFLTDTIRPYLVRVEQVVNWELIPPRERDLIFQRFIVEGILRGDQQMRADYYSRGRQWGWLSVNDIRRLEDMNPVDGGDVYLQPSNMTDAANPDPAAGGLPRGVVLTVVEDGGRKGLPGPGTEDRRTSFDAEQRSIDTRVRLQQAEVPILRRAFERVLGREASVVKRLFGSLTGGKISLEQLIAELEAFYGGEIPDRMHRELREVLLSYAQLVAAEVAQELDADAIDQERLEAMVDDYMDYLVKRHTDSSLGQVRHVLGGGQEDLFTEQIEEMTNTWTVERPGRLAERESVRSSGAFSMLAYAAAGIALIRWVTVGKNCPLCRSLDGRVVDTGQPFVTTGDIVDPGTPGTTPLKVNGIKKHPPLHRGCDCTISRG